MLVFPLSQQTPSPLINNRRVTITKAELLSQRQLTHDTFELKISCLGGNELVSARSGQFATILFPGMSKPRPYSFACDPVSEVAGEYTFFIRLVPGGEVSTWLSEKNRDGTLVELSGPLGKFQLDDSHNTMLCVGGGSGMSAIKALVEEACRQQARRDCLFFYGARSQADLYCESEMMEIKRCWHRDYKFEFIQVLSAEKSDSKWSGARGQVVEVMEKQGSIVDISRWSDVSGFLCGPKPMVEAGRLFFERKGVTSDKIYVDIFEDLSSPVPIVDNSKCVLCDECLLVRPINNCIIETSSRDGNPGLHEEIRPGDSSGLYYNSLFIDPANCIRCHACVSACPHDAISIIDEGKTHRTLRYG